MGSMSLLHWLIMALLLAIFLAPIARILKRTGFSGWWCVLSLIPLVGIIGLWVFAFVDWPSFEDLRRRDEQF
jgi:uncharacterized membrane protein YhaH (DUF805 family)